MKGITKIALVIALVLFGGLLLYPTPAKASCTSDADCTPPQTCLIVFGPGECVDLSGLQGGSCTPEKTAECEANSQVCANGVCYDPYVPPTGGQKCTQNSDCAAIGTDWECNIPWAVCIRKVTSSNPSIISSSEPVTAVKHTTTRERDDYPGCGGGFLGIGGNGGSDQECIDSVYQTDQPPPCGSNPACSQTKALPIDMSKINCLYGVNITSYNADDNAEYHAGSCSGPLMYSVNGAKSGQVPVEKRDVSALFLQGGSPNVCHWAKDTFIPSESNHQTRIAQATYTISMLNPTAAQKCVLNPLDMSGKPQIAPKCEGTTGSCTIRSGDEFSCGSCSDYDTLMPAGEQTTSCDGNSMITVQQMFYQTYDCTDKQTDPQFGAWLSCAPAETSPSQQVISSTSCRYGCSNGKCNYGKPPTLSSIAATPSVLPFNASIYVSSIASDPDTILAAGGSLGGGDSGGGSESGGGTPDPNCPQNSLYKGAVSSAVNAVINADKGTNTIFDPTDAPYGYPRVKDGKGKAYHDAVISRLSGYKACAACASYEEIAIRKSGDKFDENYDIYVSNANGKNYARDPKYIGTSCPAADTAGLGNVVVKPTFQLLTGKVIAVTGMDTAGSKEKVKLECATGPNGSGTGNNSEKFWINATCSGGAVPIVKVQWKIPSDAVQNSLLKRTTDGSFSDNPPIPMAKGTSTYTDANVDLGKVYVYRFKPDAARYVDVELGVSAANCSAVTGAVVSKPTIPLTGYASFADYLDLPITGMATPGCGLVADPAGKIIAPNGQRYSCIPGADCHGFNGPVGKINVKVYHYECKDGTTNNNGPMKVGCAVTLDSTAKTSSGKPTDTLGTAQWSCTGPFDLGRDSCFNPRGHITGEGPITCTITLDGVIGSVTFAAGQGTSGGGGSTVGGVDQGIKWDADLCVGNFTEKNPNCTIVNMPADWAKGGKRTIYCRARDESGLLSGVKSADVMVDVTPPTSLIVSPPENSDQHSAFAVQITDSDDTGLDKCYYSVNGAVSKERECNADLIVSIGPGRDCNAHGPCSVSVYATDVVNNTGSPFTRNFEARFITTNITYPFDGTYQTRDFTVSVSDMNYVPYNISDLTCTYDVYNVSGRLVKTVDKTARDCNSDFNVTVGPNGDCNALGQGACKVISRVSGRMPNGTIIEDTSERFYSIDWITPRSTFVQKPTGWLKSDVTLFINDDPSGSNITECQYKVTSNGTETVPWTARPCQTPSSTTGLKITIGAGKNCRNEGGAACRVYIRPLDLGGHPGYGDNVTLAVTFEDVDTDGFSVINALTTKRGVNFTGRTRNELSLATFYVCNAGSTVSGCIDAYKNGDSGINSQNFCGQLMLGGQGKCELRCNDQTINYYFAARGQIPSGPIRTVTVISPIQTQACPTFRIDEIINYLNAFYDLEEALNVQIMMVDQYIQQHGEDEVNNNQTLAVLQEALLLTTDHIAYMEDAMQNLDVDVANEIIERSATRMDEINQLLLGLINPTIVQLHVNMPDFVRYNTTMDMPATVTVAGPRTAYVKAYCALTKPGGITMRNSTSCMAVEEGTTDMPMSFYYDSIGTWTYACNLGRSMRSDCSYEANSTPLTGSFQVLPGLSAYIESITAPAVVVKGTNAVVTASLVNPDEITKYANVRCDFIDSQSFMRRNTSECVMIPAMGTSSADVYMLADRLGNWTAQSCTVFASQFEGCGSLMMDNVSQEKRNFVVNLPNDVYIDLITLPRSPVINDSTVQFSVEVQNPSTSAAYVTLDCDLNSPAGNTHFTDQKGIDSGRSDSFTFDIYANTLGTWSLDSCTTKKSTTPDYADSVVTYTLNDIGTFTVEKGTNLRILSFTMPSQAATGTNAVINFPVKNPSNTRFGRVNCNYRTPANVASSASSACFQINQDAVVTMPVSIFVSTQGVWTVESCSALASAAADCSSPSTHDTLSPVGSFVSTGGVGTETVGTGDIVISNVEAVSSAYLNSRTNAIVTVANSNPVNNTYAFVSCAFSDPSGTATTRTSSACYQVPKAGAQKFGVPQTLNVPGTWTVTGCYVNVSSSSSCSFASTYNRSSIIRTIDVSAASDLYVKTVNAPDTSIVNNSDVAISFTIENPLTDDDKYGSATCVITSPNGATYTRNTPCVSILKQSTVTQNVSVFANVVGTWVVTSCTANSATDAVCSSPTATGQLKNGDVFNVVKGYNLIFSSFSVNNPVYIGTNAKIDYTVNNPSTSQRFAKIKCTASKGSGNGSAVTNTTPCFSINGGAFVSSMINVMPTSLGSWDLTCDISRSTDASCSAPVTDQSLTRTLSVENPPDLYIQDVAVPLVVTNKRPFTTLLTIRNPGLVRLYGFSQCNYMNYLNETDNNRSSCEPLFLDTNLQAISYTPSYKGFWNVSNCFVNAGTNSDCSNTRRHNLSSEVNIFASTSPLLTIESISLSDTSFNVGDIVDIAVNVRDTDEISHVGFVNCTVLNPNNVLYKLTSPNQTLQADEVKTFHPKRLVDVAGTWRLVSCSVYSIHSPPVLQDSITINQNFSVSIPSTAQCDINTPCPSGQICQSGMCVTNPNACSLATCPGINSACYCSGNNCVPCGSGFSCQNHQCVATQQVNNCATDADCPSGLVCLGGACKERPPECVLTSDCPSGLQCIDSSCKAPPGQPISSDIVNLLIIVLSAISIPVILFIYIKRVI